MWQFPAVGAEIVSLWIRERSIKRSRWEVSLDTCKLGEVGRIDTL